MDNTVAEFGFEHLKKFSGVILITKTRLMMPF
jgi:hypothetical protein